MKPAAAFAIGLWTGALVVAAVSALNWFGWERKPGSAAFGSSAALDAKSAEIRALEQEKTRLVAEMQRLKQTVAELASNRVARVENEPRRLPFRRAPNLDDSWVARAVANGDLAALPRLEALAARNNPNALEALALLADRDGAEALMRAYNSATLSFTNRVRATRYLAATVEVNPRAEEGLRSLLISPNTDLRLFNAGIEGLANPGFPVTIGQGPGVFTTPHFRPDLGLRTRVLDAVRATVTDDRLRAYVDQARDSLLARWNPGESAVPAQ